MDKRYGKSGRDKTIDLYSLRDSKREYPRTTNGLRKGEGCNGKVEHPEPTYKQEVGRGAFIEVTGRIRSCLEARGDVVGQILQTDCNWKVKTVMSIRGEGIVAHSTDAAAGEHSHKGALAPSIRV